MSGEKVHKEINENITFQYLDGDENSLWSLLLSVGYIKAENVVHKVVPLSVMCQLRIEKLWQCFVQRFLECFIMDFPYITGL